MKLFQKKSIDTLLKEDSDTHNITLARKLNLVKLILMGIGAIIGAGLFSLTGFVAATFSGPAVILSFAIAAIVCLLAGLCYAEFASMVPISGSAYTYTYTSLGLLPAWLIGWDLVLEYAVAAAMVAISWSGYLDQFLKSLGLELPYSLIHSYWDAAPPNMKNPPIGIINLPALFIVMAISALLIRGINVSAKVNAVLVILKLLVIIIFIGVGWNYINQDNLSNFIPQNTGKFGAFGWSGVFRGAGLIFFAFLGFDATSTTAQEVKNPKKVLPIAMIVSLLICTALYMVFGYVMMGLVNYQSLKGTGDRFECCWNCS